MVTIISKDKVKTLDKFAVLAFTGHRDIEKAYGINNETLETYDKESFDKCYNSFKQYILSYIENNKDKQVKIVIGMARGVDEIAGLVAMNLKLPIILCIPGSLDWHKNRKDSRRGQAIYYDNFLGYQDKEIFEIKKTYSFGHKFANFARNCFMVDIATDVVSFKHFESSGTEHCIKYARKENKYRGNIPLGDLESW